MAGTGWQRTWVRIVTTLLTAAIMFMIYFFSTENATQSDHRSGIISMAVIRVVHPEYGQMDAEEQKTVYDEVQHIVRKCAHFTEYMLLGFVIRLCLESWFGFRKNRFFRLGADGIAGGTVYACTDEAHQMAIEGRMGAWSDVLVDAGGVMTGVILGTLLIRHTEKKKTGRNPQGE